MGLVVVQDMHGQELLLGAGMVPGKPIAVEKEEL